MNLSVEQLLSIFSAVGALIGILGGAFNTVRSNRRLDAQQSQADAQAVQIATQAAQATTVAQLRDEVVRLSERLLKTEMRADAAEARADKAEQRANLLQSQFDTLTRDNQELCLRIADLEKLNAEKARTVDEQNAKLVLQATQLSLANQRIAELESEVAALKKYKQAD